MQARNQATLEASERLRAELAQRRDRLVARQRRGYSSARKRLIDQLAQDYDRTLELSRRSGLEVERW